MAGPGILIVDDEPHIRALILQTLEELEDEGARFLTADNGRDALDLIRAERPRLVLLDVMMPKLSGFDVCRILKSEPELDEVLVVLLTAKGQEVDRQKGQELGADMYVTKPFDPDELLEQTRRLLDM